MDLNALILCGGLSSRMNSDKSSLQYHSLPQWKYLLGLTHDLVQETWISCRKEQAAQFSEHPLLLFDKEESDARGPARGMLEAFERFPGKAWLVVACDLPLLQKEILELLVRQRDPSRPATAFLNPVKGWPEPLLSIWEPAGARYLRERVLEGKSCPRKTLEQCGARLLDPPAGEFLFNANTPDDRAFAEARLNSGNLFKK